ncbi:MAG: hypothetical protein WC782_10300 [Methylococcaceae bacterium]|jgi:hypothetical protein
MNNNDASFAPPVPEPQALTLEDLLAAGKANSLTEYLVLSITSLGADTHVSVRTICAKPTIYSAIFYGVPTIDLQALVLGTQ